MIDFTKVLPAVRFAIGSGAWALPEQTGALFGINFRDNHDTIYMGRLFGVRDFALGLGPLASTGSGRRLWWQIGIACDAFDAAAGLLWLRKGAPKRAGILVTATALAAVGMGAAALAAEESDPVSGSPASR
jgi:hypothetical protein